MGRTDDGFCKRLDQESASVEHGRGHMLPEDTQSTPIKAQLTAMQNTTKEAQAWKRRTTKKCQESQNASRQHIPDAAQHKPQARERKTKIEPYLCTKRDREVASLQRDFNPLQL